MRGTSQVEDEVYDLSDISRNHNNFLAARVSQEPPKNIEYELDPEKTWIELTYISSENTVKFSDYVKLEPMQDRQDPAPEAESQERVYWPE